MAVRGDGPRESAGRYIAPEVHFHAVQIAALRNQLGPEYAGPGGSGNAQLPRNRIVDARGDDHQRTAECYGLTKRTSDNRNGPIAHIHPPDSRAEQEAGARGQSVFSQHTIETPSVDKDGLCLIGGYDEGVAAGGYEAGTREALLDAREINIEALAGLETDDAGAMNRLPDLCMLFQHQHFVAKSR
jgi:hypothetical protein